MNIETTVGTTPAPLLCLGPTGPPALFLKGARVEREGRRVGRRPRGDIYGLFDIRAG